MQTSPNDNFTEFSFFLFFLVCQLAQIFLPCFLGNEVIFSSNGLLNSAYNSSWELMSDDYRKLLIILMERLKHGSRILVGKLFPLSLDTFTSVNIFKLKIMAVSKQVLTFFLFFFRLYTSRIVCMLLLATPILSELCL